MNLNPFDLRGPEFLAFYVALSFLAIMVSLAWQHWIERSGPEVDENAAYQEIVKDPYAIACLRGGRNEVLRLAVVALLDRSLLLRSGKSDLQTTDAGAADLVRRPLDKAILLRFLKPASPQTVFTDTVILDEADAVGAPLREKRLLRDGEVRENNRFAVHSVTFFMWAVSLTKIGIAISRGRTNIGFLVILTVFVTIFLRAAQLRGRTSRGTRILERIKILFTGLKLRSESVKVGEGSADLTFLAAVFGLNVLPPAMSALVTSLNLVPPTPAPGSADSSSSSCGFFTTSSCGSSSSCGGGGGCGGGGCGGGGCGGCGS